VISFSPELGLYEYPGGPVILSIFKLILFKYSLNFLKKKRQIFFISKIRKALIRFSELGSILKGIWKVLEVI
jgi:hypothetical protein